MRVNLTLFNVLLFCYLSRFVFFVLFFFLFFYHHSETSEQVTYLTTTDESFKPCDMDERDWTSLESSSESIIDFNADGEFKVSSVKHD